MPLLSPAWYATATLRIAHVTNYWPNYHGHAHYTQNLLRAMQARRPGKQYVVAEGAAAAVDDATLQVVPSWRRGTDYVDDVLAGLRHVQADVAYLQYSPDLFGDDERFPRLVRAIEDAGTRSVVVTHSVYDRRQRSGYQPGGRIEHFDRAVGTAASCLHVHSRRCRTELVARGVAPDKVVVIPHGSLPMQARDKAASRAQLGLPPDARVVLFFGFIWTGKGLSTLIDAFARLAPRVPDAYLYIAGYTRKRRFGFYVKALELRGRLRGVGARMKLWGAYVPDDMVPAIYSAADVVAMPYQQDYASVSGVVHQTAGMGKLMLCSSIWKFDEVGEHISPELLAPPGDAKAWAHKLERLLTDERFAADMRARILRFGAETSWENVAGQHLALCDRLVAAPLAAAVG